MTEQIPEAVSWGLAVALVATAVLLMRQHGITRRQRRRNAVLADGLRARDDELRHLVSGRLPAPADSPHQPAPDVGPLDARLAGTDFAKALDEILVRFSRAVEYAQARADQSAKAALKASMRSLQALANEQQVSISGMQDRHDRPDVLRDLLEIDHTNAQFGRRAQAIAVLCGSWPGRQRATSPLLEVVRGATSRIRDYRRVRVGGQADVAVESRVVEPVVLAVAELLDNAARHSQPNTSVEVTVQSVHNGVCVIVDDAGVGMDGQAVERAGELLTGRRAVDVTRLDDPPRFGFAVIGVLARRYGFSVSVDTRSPYGGVRAVVFLPPALLTQGDAAASKPVVSEAGAPKPPVPEPVASEPVVLEPSTSRTPASAPRPEPVPRPAEAEGTTAGGLPKRRRRTPRKPAAVPSVTAETEGANEPPPTRSPEENARIMGAFARGTRFGREAGKRVADEALRQEAAGEPAPDDPEPEPLRHEAELEPLRHESAWEALRGEGVPAEGVRGEGVVEAVRHEPVLETDGYGAVRADGAAEAVGDGVSWEPGRYEAALGAVHHEAEREAPRPGYEPVWEALGREAEPDPDGAPGPARGDPGPGRGDPGAVRDDPELVRDDDPAPQEAARTNLHDDEGTPPA